MTTYYKVNPDFGCDECWDDFEVVTGVSRFDVPDGWFSAQDIGITDTEIEGSGALDCLHGNFGEAIFIVK